MNIPTGHQTIMPYLILKDAAAFLDFMQQVFGATVSHKSMQPDGKTIRHAEVQLGNSTIMFSNATNEYGPQPAGLFIYVPDADATFKKALEHGGTSIMEPADQPYGRSGGIADTNGNSLWITSVK
ncbi:glyoxalase/bleomycin resistance/extradiol dioxygenase family protein [Chitinophaga sp. sic0106]|uniref:VOC family protein n=1 Tax=Chitinophaga sp. sic0106 TaxID=2854785 RepID=UPI001C44803C|nr:VOC family protein [Chitinophaga sp. sic0106]MBV7529829.1 VOC family protein [Chitinophaga sp. sic0106]